MTAVWMIIFILAGGILFTIVNLIVRRWDAEIRIREDYDEDVDNKLSKKEKKRLKEEMAKEEAYLKVSLRDVYKERPVRSWIVSIIGLIAGAAVMYFFGIRMYGGVSLQAVQMLMFWTVLMTIGLIDMDTMEIPFELNCLIIVLGCGEIYVNPEVTLGERIIGALCVSAFLLIITLIISGAFGGGDIKLMFAAGWFLGWRALVPSFFIGLFIGAGVGIYMITKRKKGGKEHIPFGPSLCIGLAIGSVCGEQIMNWYVDMIKTAAGLM